jgi:adenosine deaminase
VPSIEDPLLIDYLREHQVHLEICPTCNIQTDIYPTYLDHPIDKLFQAGISIGVNSDTRTMTNVTLSQEYEKLSRIFGLEAEDFYLCNHNALDAAFVPAEVHAGLLTRLTNGYE